jgi:hypothetical protein
MSTRAGLGIVIVWAAASACSAGDSAPEDAASIPDESAPAPAEDAATAAFCAALDANVSAQHEAKFRADPGALATAVTVTSGLAAAPASYPQSLANALPDLKASADALILVFSNPVNVKDSDADGIRDGVLVMNEATADLDEQMVRVEGICAALDHPLAHRVIPGA